MSRSLSRFLFALLFVLLIVGCGQNVQLVMPSMTGLPAKTGVELRTLHQDTEQRLKKPGTQADKAALCAALGTQYFAFAQWDGASAAFLQARTFDPKNTRYLYLLGLSHAEAGQLAEAEAAWRELLETSSHDFHTNARLGLLLAQAGRWEEARVCFERAQQVNPDEAVGHFGMGLVDASTGKDAEAVPALQKALTLQPSASAINEPLGLALDRLGEKDRAAMFLRRKGDVLPTIADPFFTRIQSAQAEMWVKQAVDMAGDHGNFDHTTFQTFVRSHLQTTQGLEQLKKVAQERVSAEAPDAVELARLHFAIGDLLRLKDEPEEMFRNFTYAVQLHPAYKELFMDLATMLLRYNNYESVMKMMEAILAGNPNHREANILYQTARIASGNPDLIAKAQAELEAWVATESQDAAALSLLGQAYWAQNQTAAAQATFQRVVATDLQDEEKAGHFGMYARFLSEQGDLAGARALLDKGLVFSPNAPDLKFQMGTVLVKQKEYAAAATAYGEALKLGANQEQVYLARSGALTLAQNFRDAITTLEDGLGEIPQSVEIANQLARLRAICPDESLRDPAKSLILARETYNRTQSARHAETFAMALAANALWDEAIGLQKNLVSAAQAKKQTEIAAALAVNLNRYQAKQACCQQFDAFTLVGERL